MKEILSHYAAYNYWANQQLAGALLKLNEEQLDRELGGSFATLRQTVHHLWCTEQVWYQRLQLQEKTTDPLAGFTGTFATACQHWLEQSLLLQQWVQQATQVRLNHTIAFMRKKNEPHKMDVFQVVMHVNNHGTYHRGQLVHMLRQLGVTKIPNTDYHRFKPKK
ncbi:DinB family protein [Chitinophaga nivalis]|uniref:DinB family protein n=1 Tax=Chitinophaga nivalis TaxID=2991709 RepID=A0ABT3ISP2_9BACT|nr:DinB family protein [Chitinophaga nivalis]MCW3463308.1 DinB family protein [Chitinophaga nivalis]MCW3487002.1 DinB family protein [Chitinophaga nivalis]